MRTSPLPNLLQSPKKHTAEHLRVAVHAVDAHSIKIAIDARADSIEHGNEVTDEELNQMRQTGIFLDLTPTFNDLFYLKVIEPSIVISPASRAAGCQSQRTP